MGLWDLELRARADNRAGALGLSIGLRLRPRVGMNAAAAVAGAETEVSACTVGMRLLLALGSEAGVCGWDAGLVLAVWEAYTYTCEGLHTVMSWRVGLRSGSRSSD